MKNSKTNLARRNFIKTSALSALVLSNASALVLDSNINEIEKLRFTYFLKDSNISSDIKADKILIINNDISDIYSELMTAFKSKATIGGIGSETTLFVISKMAADHGLRAVYDKNQNGVHEFIIAAKGVKI